MVMNGDKEQAMRLEHLYELRRSVLDEMEEADRELSRIRMQVERAESDLRIGDAGPANYEQMKGHQLPQAEGRFLEAYRSLVKLEEKITTTRQRVA
jgi:DNA-binding transcriptional LysR family regulator